MACWPVIDPSVHKTYTERGLAWKVFHPTPAVIAITVINAVVFAQSNARQIPPIDHMTKMSSAPWWRELYVIGPFAQRLDQVDENTSRRYTGFGNDVGGGND